MENQRRFTEIRKIREAAQDLKFMDPKTAVTESFIRKLVKTKKIPVIKNGRTIMINFSVLCDYIEKMSLGLVDPNDDSEAPVCEVLM